MFLQNLVSSLLGLGIKRLVYLGIVGLTVFSMMALVVYGFRAPVKSVLYSSLDKADVNAIGAALSEVGIAFDVSETGDAVLVEFGKTAQARMLLAERGLPKSDKSGYELFDQMGSLGLTSFMQQVTKVRALEGELVRTIQQLDGIKSTRVHLALKVDGVLRNKDSRPTASVVIRIDGSPRESLASTIRHIVAAAIPGLQPEQVMISTTDGKLLAGPRNSEDATSGELLDLETKVSKVIRDRLSNTLEPFAGAENIRVSVSTTINFDKRQINETKFDPNSKVERSLSTIKSLDTTKDGGTAPTVSVDQNIPQEVKPASGNSSTNKKKEDKQETVNYEVDSTQTATTTAGYTIERMSVAVVIDRKAAFKSLPEGSDEKQLTARLSEIEAVARSAAGVIDKRGDSLKISAIDFYADESLPDESSKLGVADHIVGNLGTIVNALSLVGATLLVIFLGLRPALRMLITEVRRDAGVLSLPAIDKTSNAVSGTSVNLEIERIEARPEALPHNIKPSPADQLNKLVNVDVDRAAQVLKRWLNDPKRNAA